MVDNINGCTEINLGNPSHLPTLQFNLQCMEHAQKCITGTQTFPINKLDGWKHTTAFHRSSKTNRHQTLKHLNKQYGCYLNRLVIGNSAGRWAFRNWVVIGLSPASWETTQTNTPPKHNTKMEGHNISSSLKKSRKHTQWVSATIRVQV